jgi:magnesium transporter
MNSADRLRAIVRPVRAGSRKLLRIRRRAAIGAPPGTLLADPEAPPPRLSVLVYDAERCEEAVLDTPDAYQDYRRDWPMLWADVEGLGDADVVQRVGDVFGLHRLALEDVLNTYQRAKTEEYSDHVFVVARMTLLDHGELHSEQIGLFVGRGWLVTFQERPGDCFDPVRDRIRQARGRIRVGGPSYLAYALLDAIVDNYFPVLEHYGERLEDLEDDVVQNPTPDVVNAIRSIRRDLLGLRRAVWPMREAIGALMREGNAFVDDETRVYLRDCYDHTIQVIDLLENYREIASGLMDVYLSSVSNRMNEIMKVLTIIATVFIPLTFVVGVYGMNFNTSVSRWNMPELAWRWGYPAVWGVMLLIALGLFLYFRRKRWI